MSAPMISRPYSIALDAVRFACAFVVLACHSGGGSPIYNGPWLLGERASHYAVVVFFVLSGLVISASVAERQTSLKAYALARATRIVPVAAIAVLFSMLMHTLYLMQSGPLPPGYGGGLAYSALISLTFLSESGFGGDLSWNGTYWSLCYEVWYYALFGAAVFLRGRLRWGLLTLMGVIAGWQVLLLLPIWLGGVWLCRGAWPRSVTLDRAPLLLTACFVGIYFVTIWDMAMLVWLRETLPFALGMAEWVVSDYAMGALVIAGLAALRPIAERHSAQLERVARPITYLAGFSFTLYLFHMPVLTLLHLAGFAPSKSPLVLVVGWLLILAICAAIGELVELRTPALRRAVIRALDARVAKAAVAA